MYFGGIIGSVGSDATVAMKNCTSSANITAKTQVGGLIGGMGETTTLTMENCEFTGTITVTDADGTSGKYVGSNPDWAPAN